LISQLSSHLNRAKNSSWTFSFSPGFNQVDTLFAMKILQPFQRLLVAYETGYRTPLWLLPTRLKPGVNDTQQQ